MKKPEDQWSSKCSPDLDSFTCRGANDPCPGVCPVWTPGAQVAGFKKRIIEHCYTQNKNALVLMVSEIFGCFSHSKNMGANGPQGHDWQDLCRAPLS